MALQPLFISGWKQLSAYNSKIRILNWMWFVKSVQSVFNKTYASRDSQFLIELYKTYNTVIGYDDVKELERTYSERASKEEYSQAAIDAYLEWHSAAVVYLNDFYSEDNSDYSKFKNVDNSGNGYVLNNIFRGLYSKYVLLMEQYSVNSYVID